MDMFYRYLGKTGLQLSALSFGSWVTFHKQVDDSLADRLMGIAYDKGVNFFDNAEVYARGESELMMGRVLKGKNWDRASYVLSSKAYFGSRGPGNKPNHTGLSRKHLTEACHEALQRMQVDYLDLYYCHRPDPNVPMEEIVWSMHNLITQGKVLYWGTSMWSGAEIMEAHMIAQRHNLIGPVVEQPLYNMFERGRIELDFLPVYRTVGLGTTIWSPLASGLLTGKYNNGIPEGSRLGLKGFEWLKERWLTGNLLEKVKKLQKVADEIEEPLAAMAIAWTLKHPGVTTSILGATSENQLNQNFEALRAYEKLTEAVMEKIEGILQNKPEAVMN